MNLRSEVPVVFTAQSKQYFYCCDTVCAYVLKEGFVPLNPFKVFDYFLNDRVDRDLIRRANFNLVRRSDELWVFGDTIANGVLAEIKYAIDQRKPIRFFTISASLDEIRPLDHDELEHLLTAETELAAEVHDDEFRKCIGMVQEWLQITG